jgi:hypothetical protein
VSTLTITKAPLGATISTDQPPADTDWAGTWVILEQEAVAYGSPADAGEAGRIAVREHADALRILRDR